MVVDVTWPSIVDARDRVRKERPGYQYALESVGPLTKYPSMASMGINAR